MFLHFPKLDSLIFKVTLGTNRENELYFCHIQCSAFAWIAVGIHEQKFDAATKPQIVLVHGKPPGIEHSRECHFYVDGVCMKGAMFAVAVLTVGCCTLPTFAQQQDLQEVMDATNTLSARENELLSKKDAAAIASLFTSDGLLVILAPQFAFKPGRNAIQKHHQGIIDAGVSNITLELKNLELRGNDGVWAAGSYSAIVKDQTIHGNWFRILKRENGTWKIAMEAIARADVLDAPAGSSPVPSNGK